MFIEGGMWGRFNLDRGDWKNLYVRCGKKNSLRVFYSRGCCGLWGMGP